MPRSITELRVFISSPGDMRSDHAVVNQVIDEINESLEGQGLKLSVIAQGKGITPGIGAYPQDVVNRQLQDVDIYVGLLGVRFGSPTPGAESGTEEEFNLFYKKYKENTSSTRVLFYFKEATDNLGSLDFEQYGKVRAFKASLGEKGVLYDTYKSRRDLDRLLKNHIRDLLRTDLRDGKWISQIAEARGAPEGAPTQCPVEDVSSDPAVDESPGWLDYQVEFSAGVDQIVALMQAIGDLTADAADTTNVYVVERLPAVDIPSEKRRLLNEFAELMVRFSANLRVKVMQLKKVGPETLEHALGLVGTPDGEGWLYADSDESRASLQGFRNSVFESRGHVQSFHDSTMGARGAVAGWPRATSKLAHAQSRICESLDELLAALVSMLNKYDAILEGLSKNATAAVADKSSKT